MRKQPSGHRAALAAAAAIAITGGVQGSAQQKRGEQLAQNVFDRLREHEVRFARLNVLRNGWREQCSRPDVDPALKKLVEQMLDAIDHAVDRPA